MKPINITTSKRSTAKKSKTVSKKGKKTTKGNM